MAPGGAECSAVRPLARAIVKAAAAHGGVPRAEAFRAKTRRGVEARLNGAMAAVGGPALLREYGAAPPAAVRTATKGWIDRGATVLHVLRDKQIIGALALEDQIRPESWQAVEQLHRRGVRVVMITGAPIRWQTAWAGPSGWMRSSPRYCPRPKTRR